MSARRTNYPPIELRPKGSAPESFTATMGHHVPSSAPPVETPPPSADVRSGEAIAPRPANGEGLTPIATLECGSHVVSVAIFESAVRGRSVELTINHPRSRRPFVMHLYRGEAAALAAHLLRASEQILAMRVGTK